MLERQMPGTRPLVAGSWRRQPPRGRGRWGAAVGSPADQPRARPVLLLHAHEPLRIVFVSTEVAPWSKSGGLGDVMEALPEALAAMGHQVTTLTRRACKLRQHA